MRNFLDCRLPEWTRKVYPGGALAKLSEYWLDQITGTTELKRLRSGFLLQEIFDRFKNKTLSQLSPVNRVMWLYSGHDSTISSVLNTLGLFKVLEILNALIAAFHKYSSEKYTS